MNAQVAACRTGEARFQAILDRFGYETAPLKAANSGSPLTLSAAGRSQHAYAADDPAASSPRS
jgi:hypothetical protein